MKITTVDISAVIPNEKNPRTIKTDKFKKLVQSIKKFPQMLELRPIVVNGDMVVLGGNMRLRACIEAGLKKVPIIRAEDLTEEQQKEFVIKDNVGYGEWDFEMLNAEFPLKQLHDWALEVPVFTTNVDIEKFFAADTTTKPGMYKLVFDYNEEDYKKVVAAFQSKEGAKEKVLMQLLGA